MAIRIYDTLTRQLQELPPPDRHPELAIYVCGPTVYDDPHIGHARSAYVFDVIRRYLTYRGYRVRFIRNVTDVDDKIIQRARETGQTVEQVSEQYLVSYHQAMAALGIQPPTEEPRATAHIPRMQAMIKDLVRKKAAYLAANGDVYFAVRAFSGYGKLSNRSVDELRAGARVEPGEEKRDPLDFVLWKVAKPAATASADRPDEPRWMDETPQEPPLLAPGRPGWHIECSAMSMQYLGETFDIHGGGVDLVFPHHENEIAQSQAFTGDPRSFARYWMHNGLLTINGQKMSKSLGNFVTLDQALGDCQGDVNVLKLFFLMSHYRSSVDYNPLSLRVASEMLERIDQFRLQAARANPVGAGEGRDCALKGTIDRYISDFHKALDNDFHTPMALASIFEMISFVYAHLSEQPPVKMGEFQLLQYSADAIKTLFQESFGMGLPLKVVLKEKITVSDYVRLELSFPSGTPQHVKMLVEEREAARQQKDFKRADAIRQHLASVGWVVEDTAQGPSVRSKSHS